MAECYIGIDFGACNIKAAKYQNNKIKSVKLNRSQGDDNDIPNVIFYDKNSDDSIAYKVGRAAGYEDAENVVAHIKTKLTLPAWQKFIPNLGRDVGTEEVVTDIFRVLLKTMQNQWPERDATPPTTITTPVCFSEIQKQKLRRCAEKAGFVVEAVVTEPFAAMFADSDFLDECMESEDEQNILVFDFGGSTLDLSVLKLENGDEFCITELASKGIFFGGLTIDNDIYENIVKVKFAEELKAIFANNDKVRVEQELLEKIAIAKEQIFEQDDDDDDVDADIYYTSPSDGKTCTFNITREEIIELFDKKGYSQRLTGLLEDMFDEIDDISEDEITKIVIVGGSSKISYFLKCLTDFFGKDIFDYEDFDRDQDIYMSVAKGAAGFLGLKKDQTDRVKVHNSIPFNLGLDIKGKFRTLINKNVPYGFESKIIPIEVAELTNKKFILNVYQTFSDKRVLSFTNNREGENEIIYVGSVELNQEKYALDRAPLLSVKMQENSEMLVTMSELRDIGKRELEIVKVEELKVKVGDN